jgi:6-pyruvoyltetrahydropterin/6-carboxytetrahydropterin synthase
MYIQKSIVIEMAHRLPHHLGKCRNIHGHSWEITVAVSGSIKKEHGPNDGMVEDFNLLKSALGMIDSVFDHTLALADYDPLGMRLRTSLLSNTVGPIPAGIVYPWGEQVVTEFGKINILKDIPPTSENLTIIWKDMLVASMPGSEVISVSVKETKTSESTWVREEEE